MELGLFLYLKRTHRGIVKEHPPRGPGHDHHVVKAAAAGIDESNHGSALADLVNDIRGCRADRAGGETACGQRADEITGADSTLAVINERSEILRLHILDAPVAQDHGRGSATAQGLGLGHERHIDEAQALLLSGRKSAQPEPHACKEQASNAAVRQSANRLKMVMIRPYPRRVAKVNGPISSHVREEGDRPRHNEA